MYIVAESCVRCLQIMLWGIFLGVGMMELEKVYLVVESCVSTRVLCFGNCHQE